MNSSLREKYADDPRVRFTYFDNSRGKGNGKFVQFADLPSLVDTSAYGQEPERSEAAGVHAPVQRGSSGTLEARLREALDAEHQAGRISDAVYRGFAGQDPVTPAPADSRPRASASPAAAAPPTNLRRHAIRLQAGLTAALTIEGGGKVGSSKVRVFATAQQAREAGFAVDDGNDGFFEPTTGTVGVVAENVPDIDRGLWVAMHEQSGHKGLIDTFGDSPALAAEMQRAGTNATVRAVADALARERGYGEAQDALAVEESLAELQAAVRTGNWKEITDRYGVKADDLAKSGVAGVMRRMLRAIRNAIAKATGRPSSAYSDADVMALLENSHKAGLRAKPQETYNGRDENAGRTSQAARGRASAATAATAERDAGRVRGSERGVGAQRRPDAQAPRAGRLPGATGAPGFRGPDSRLVRVAQQFARAAGIKLARQGEYAAVDPERAARIADAYTSMPHAPNDPAVREAYENLIQQARAQYEALAEAGYRFWFIDIASDAGQQYSASPWNAMRDIRANQRMGIFPTLEGFGSDAGVDVSDNPLLSDTGLQWPFGGPDGELRPVLANDLFRAVHDAFGHGLEGAGFRADGEENAWQAHARLFTGSALGALTSETRGQNSWVNYGPHGEHNRTAKAEDTIFADQKTGLMPEWTWQEGRVPDMRESRARRTIAPDGQEQAREQGLRDQAPRAGRAGRRPDAAGDQGARGVDGRARKAEHGGSASAQAWHQREPRPGAVTVRGIHYSAKAGLAKLDGSKYCTKRRVPSGSASPVVRGDEQDRGELACAARMGSIAGTSWLYSSNAP